MKGDGIGNWAGAAGLGLLGCVCLVFAYRLGEVILPRQRCRATPWGALEVGVVLGVFGFFLPPLIAGTLRVMVSDFAASVRFIPMVALLSGCITIAGVPRVMIRLTGAELYQMGIHSSHWVRNVVLGLLAYPLSLPPVAAAFYAASEVFEVQPHAIEQIVRKNPSADILLLTGFTAVVLAPLQEELLFRGLLLPWLRRLWGGWGAILGSSLLFAALHADAWPAPIPLFVLALFLGYLAYRTGSLVGPVVLHATFNGISMIRLLVLVQSDTAGALVGRW